MINPSPHRVASRFLAAREWGDTTKLVADYRSALSAFQASVNATQQTVVDAYSRFSLTPGSVDRSTTKAISAATRGRLSHSMVPLIHAARPLSEWIIQTRVIPPGKAKAIEMAARAVGSMARLPQDILDWNKKNGDRLNLLLEAASWPERSGSDEAASQVVTVGPFKVHNTIGASDKQFKEIQGLVENAVRTLSTTRDFKKVLYGDVFVVGQLKQSRTLAWYNVTNDEVYVRSLAKKGFDDLASLTHELGHRYWFKFTAPDVKKKVWGLYYDTQRAASRGSASQSYKPGDVIPIKVKGVKGDPVVDKVEGGFYHLAQGGRILVRDVDRIMSQRAAFPTPYAATSVEEFFAECFSFYTMGKLKPNLAESFLAALG